MTTKFSVRALEHHHSLNLDPDGVDSQEDLCRRLEWAGEKGFNRIFLGERWPKGLNGLLTYGAEPDLAKYVDLEAIEKRKRAFEKIAECASESGIEIHAIYHPIYIPPEYRKLHPDILAVEPPGWDRQLTHQPLPEAVCPLNSKVLEFIKKQISELVSIPQIKGVSCWLNQSESRFFDCSCEKCEGQKIDETLGELCEALNEPCSKVGKVLNIRTYLGSWQCGLETECFLELHERLSPEIKFTYKQQQGDMYNEHPPNPLLGQLGSRPQAIEFDTYGEYRGHTMGFLGSVRHQLQEGIIRAQAKGVDGVVVRGIHAESPLSVDTACIAALLKNPEADVDKVALGELQAYGAMAPQILSLMDAMTEISRICMYVRGVFWPSWTIPPNIDRLRFILFDRSAPCVPGAFEALKVDSELLKELEASLGKAWGMAQALPEKAKETGRELEAHVESALLSSAISVRSYALICRNFVPTFMRFFGWEATQGATMREYLKFDLLKSLDACETDLDQAERELELIDLESISFLKGEININSKMTQKSVMESVVNARKVCLDISELIDRPKTSFTGISPWPKRWPGAISPELFGAHRARKDFE